MKYLSEFFVPYDTFSGTNILLTCKSCILNSFLFMQKLLLLIYLSSKFMPLFHSFLYLVKINLKYFYSNLHILRMVHVLA